MERIGNKVSYIKKPFAKNSFVAAGLAAAALVFYAAAISFSYYTQGNAPLAAAALGFCSIIIAVSSVVYGVCHDGEREELSSGEDQPCGGGDPAAGVGTDDRVCAVKMTGRNRE